MGLLAHAFRDVAHPLEERIDQSLVEEYPALLARLNRKLHQTIYTAAHNQYLLQTLGQLDNALALLRGTTYRVPGRAASAAAEHRDIVEAICRRDAEAAESAARAHIAAAQTARLRLILEEEEHDTLE